MCELEDGKCDLGLIPENGSKIFERKSYQCRDIFIALGNSTLIVRRIGTQKKLPVLAATGWKNADNGIRYRREGLNVQIPDKTFEELTE